MNMLTFIEHNKEWLFSGIGVVIVFSIIKLFRKKKIKSHLITVTIAGGEYFGPENDYSTTINKNEILRLEDSDEDDVGKTVIIMKDNTRLHVTESKTKIIKMMNREMIEMPILK